MEKNNNSIFFFYPDAEEGQPRKVIAGVFNSNTNTLIIAKSECSPKDNFCKDKGRKIALGRALCNREIKVKEYKGKQSKTNKNLLPRIFNLESAEKPQQKFIQIAKSL